MLYKELPMIPGKILPGEKRESCQDNLCCEAEKTLIRLYGDRGKARERCLLVCNQVKRIDEEETDREIKVFKAAADATRLRILKLLAGGELGICEIMLALKKPQSSISHNLSILEDAGLVKERKEGKWCRYRISDESVMDMINLAGQQKRK
jgi:ArsR family transcriptional regulator